MLALVVPPGNRYTQSKWPALIAHFCPPIETNMPTSTELYDAADRLKDEGKLPEAVATLEQLLAQDPKYTLAHSALAVMLGRLQRHEEAIQHALKVSELAPNDPFSFTALSVTYVRAGRIQEAEDAKARAHMLSGHRH